MVASSSARVLKVALTGGIATGKSHVLTRFRDRAVPTIDADDLVHQAFSPGTETTRAIATQLGSGFLKADGSVDRKRLGARVFDEEDTRRQVESIVHPFVYDAILKWFAALQQALGVASIPLLYETGHENDFDVVVATVCSPEQQLRRIVARDRISEAEARQRIAAQMPALEKANRADFVIQTDGTLAETDRKVDDVHAALRNLTSS
jgi:dephospho-CoA kinase